jgi:hypothetical protein
LSVGLALIEPPPDDLLALDEAIERLRGSGRTWPMWSGSAITLD